MFSRKESETEKEQKGVGKPHGKQVKPQTKFNKEAKADSKAKANQKDYKAQNIKKDAGRY